MRILCKNELLDRIQNIDTRDYNLVIKINTRKSDLSQFSYYFMYFTITILKK